MIPPLDSSAVQVFGDAIHDSDACTVHRARILTISSGQGPLALKRIKISNAAAFDRFERERAVLEMAEHPCIVKPIFILQDAPCYGLVLPLAERGSLSDMLHKPTAAPLPRPLVVCFCHDLVSALEYVHTQLQMLHRDVKPANAVVDEWGRAVLIDFDRACSQAERPGEHRRKGPSGGRHKDYMVGTLVYMAPELLERRPWSAGSDVYSLAITMNEMVTGCVPFSDVRYDSFLLGKLVDLGPELAAGIRPCRGLALSYMCLALLFLRTSRTHFTSWLIACVRVHAFTLRTSTEQLHTVLEGEWS